MQIHENAITIYTALNNMNVLQAKAEAFKLVYDLLLLIATKLKELTLAINLGLNFPLCGWPGLQKQPHSFSWSVNSHMGKSACLLSYSNTCH